jgi:hypothetical protein
MFPDPLLYVLSSLLWSDELNAWVWWLAQTHRLLKVYARLLGKVELSTRARLGRGSEFYEVFEYSIAALSSQVAQVVLHTCALKFISHKISYITDLRST